MHALAEPVDSDVDDVVVAVADGVVVNEEDVEAVGEAEGVVGGTFSCSLLHATNAMSDTIAIAQRTRRGFIRSLRSLFRRRLGLLRRITRELHQPVFVLGIFRHRRRLLERLRRLTIERLRATLLLLIPNQT
jgi:hypothetical protein